MFHIVVVQLYLFNFFFFQAEDGIRDVERSRGLGDVYKRQVAIPFFRGIYFLTAENPPGDNPMTTGGLIVTGVTVLVLVVIFALMFRAKLKTKITADKLSVCFPPLVWKWKAFDPSEIEKYEIRRYHPNREYGGRGIKRRLRKGTAWTVTGRIGLQLYICLLYTSDAADDTPCVDLGGRRTLKKKTTTEDT
eukprot:TRINITY_DN25587_c0_g1_i2.p4 TRINITY_DN25587_c0_g1~~TRINITY_DN25587_c0_g1_i2.p4  ORF type:complete len:191 (-),score=37.25 TRINITY_DN25587_c0_g1_i2:66-638(-)